eukprot:m.45382 g.45382  ORF g.45382 m.45382 type:complete len:200 (+) comp10878_c0_seq1:259-858(+)
MALVWAVKLPEGDYTIEFTHGTTSGKRVIVVNGQEILRKNWMFKLVGVETFTFGTGTQHTGMLSIEALSMTDYKYSLTIDGKTLEELNRQAKAATRSWHFEIGGTTHLCTINLDTMQIYCDGTLVESVGEFVEDGTETHFTVEGQDVYVLATPAPKTGKLEHILYVNDEEVSVAQEEERANKVGWHPPKSAAEPSAASS